MKTIDWKEIEKAKKAALEVLIHNSHGPYHGFRGLLVGDIRSLIQEI